VLVDLPEVCACRPGCVTARATKADGFPRPGVFWYRFDPARRRFVLAPRAPERSPAPPSAGPSSGPGPSWFGGCASGRCGR